MAFPEGSYSQSISTNTEEFWKDSEIVKEHDFSDGETFPAQNASESFIKKETKHSAVSCTPISPVIKDVFSGSPWKPLSVEQHKELSQQLLQEFSNKRNMLESRNLCLNDETKTLPVASHRERILELIERNQVVVISGETGCGKTTQIPQFILDDAIQKGNGSACNIMVTQPRRIVAMSIAERVASERREMLGKSVGYQVRLEGRLPSQKGCILFCTTGILLRRMQSNVLLKGVSHVIVDEVHERDINTDFLLILLKDLLGKNQDVKIIVMSATVNSERFSQYFRGCPSLVIPGFTHDVTEYFLSEVCELLGRTPLSKPETVKSKRFKPDCSSSQTSRDADSPEADAQLVTETILFASKNYPE
ncbi:putative ATP-dependent RNA helicase DHX30, partial [Stylophora pistillata]|uniref:putative ATP-dependent RNA helicase DHX30 n=1 Tax=Stylophora pistillata TaxID=50429 RepID=UPI000C03A8BA